MTTTTTTTTIDDTLTSTISNNDNAYCNNFDCIIDERIIQTKNDDDNYYNSILQYNSQILDCLAYDILSDFKGVVTVERKFTTKNKTLAGITIDWRQLRDWKDFKKTSEPLLKEAIDKQQKPSFNGNTLYTQTYATHPFIDVYAVKYDKGIAFDDVISEHIIEVSFSIKRA